MNSRRNVRIKIMQVLFSGSIQDGFSEKQYLAKYHYSIGKTFDSLVMALGIIDEICQFALIDEKNRKEKLLPNDEDKIFKANLATNPVALSLNENAFLQEFFDKKRIKSQIGTDLIRKQYQDFLDVELYQEFYKKESVTQEESLQVILKLWKMIIGYEIFDDSLFEYSKFWHDDSSLVIGIVKRILKKLPADTNILEEFINNNDTIFEYGEQLLKKVIEKNESIEKIIFSTVDNWDSTRLATMDLVLIKMAVAEFLYFPTIPTKVTLNEYLEIAKMYSTKNSHEFINGVLDVIMKDFISRGKIMKMGRGLK